MLIACWSAKGGSGTTVVAAALALSLARRRGASVLVDLDGDAPAVLGTAEPQGPGLGEWFAAGPEVATDALTRLEQPVVDGLALLARGRGPLPSGERAEVLAGLLAADDRPVVADCGVLGPSDETASLNLAAVAVHSLLVTRACYVALRRAVAAPLAPTGIVLVEEDGRALDPDDVAHVLGVEVLACVPSDPAVSRAVDAGLLVARLPRRLVRPLERLT